MVFCPIVYGLLLAARGKAVAIMLRCVGGRVGNTLYHRTIYRFGFFDRLRSRVDETSSGRGLYEGAVARRWEDKLLRRLSYRSGLENPCLLGRGPCSKRIGLGDTEGFDCGVDC